ncbi:MAG: hypothetical protein QGH83_16120 [Candidatus Pacebacteria bacterium]|jgi:hypothetical protein|nr:hypothetical protein [Candidatus Paceibacterota bacterium]|tara:strand:- start:41 stop:259 length:219 start_codon:yes stop_codon:yes gene_type:complete
MLDQISGWIKQVTNIGLGLIALGVVLQILFGAAVPFLGLDVVGSVVSLVKDLGSEGLVGLVAIWVLWGIYSK